MIRGLAVPSLKTIAEYHPQFALAAASGVPVRPDIRPLQAQFGSAADIGTVVPASFAEVVSGYSVFAGAKVTIDPTNGFAGNILKGLSDVTQAMVSGITCTLVVRGDTDDYSPIPEDTPLQDVPDLLGASAGAWKLDRPANVKARFTLQSIAGNGPPFTVWLNLVFLVLQSEGARFMCLGPAEARQKLRELGVC